MMSELIELVLGLVNYLGLTLVDRTGIVGVGVSPWEL